MIVKPLSHYERDEDIDAPTLSSNQKMNTLLRRQHNQHKIGELSHNVRRRLHEMEACGFDQQKLCKSKKLITNCLAPEIGLN